MISRRQFAVIVGGLAFSLGLHAIGAEGGRYITVA